MKRFPLSVGICALLGAAPLPAADYVPRGLNFDRYSGMLNRSPFAVATVVAAPAATPNWAKDLYVASVARTGDGDIVTMMSTGDKNLKEYLTTKGPSQNGYFILNIQWSPAQRQK